MNINLKIFICYIFFLFIPSGNHQKTNLDDITITIQMPSKAKKQINKHTLLTKIAKIESNNNPDTVNRYGYIGKYQFGRQALKQIREDVCIDTFKKNPKTWPESRQDSAMLKLLKENKRMLHHEIKRYDNTFTNDILITEDIILALAHFCGQKNTKAWLNGENKFKDRNNLSIEEYINRYNNIR